MSGTWKILIGVSGMAVLGAAVFEHGARRTAEHRCQQVVEARRQLEIQFGEVLATHEQLKGDLTREQQHAQELMQALAGMRARMEEAVGRLTDETRQVRELQTRLASMQQQMDQLQGELAVTIQDRQQSGALTGTSAPVQLERIVVSDAASLGPNGHVLSVHRNWNFVVVDLGWDTVKIGDMVSIFRNDQLLAKARVDRVQEGVCAATILPGWETAEIRINDLARVF